MLREALLVRDSEVQEKTVFCVAFFACGHEKWAQCNLFSSISVALFPAQHESCLSERSTSHAGHRGRSHIWRNLPRPAAVRYRHEAIPGLQLSGLTSRLCVKMQHISSAGPQLEKQKMRSRRKARQPVESRKLKSIETVPFSLQRCMLSQSNIVELNL